jgi:hypothetical protein
LSHTCSLSNFKALNFKRGEERAAYAEFTIHWRKTSLIQGIDIAWTNYSHSIFSGKIQMLADEIYQYALAISDQHRATDIRVGLGCTAVALEDGRCALAYILHEQEHESCTVIADAGTLAGRKASELISWIK